jgi:glycosyltransferase involved in cell wall biosynthesis
MTENGRSEASVPSAPLCVVVLTFNEALNLPACLGSLAGLPCEIYVVDSASTDRTVEIAAQHRVRVVPHNFESHARQWKWALDSLPITADWVLALDADQLLSEGLRDELCQLFTGQMPKVDGFYVKRRQIFRGRWIRHGGYYPKYLLKLFKRHAVQFDENDLVDHHFYIAGSVAKLRGDLIEDNRKESDISFWIDKHNRYASLLAREEIRRRTQPQTRPLQPALGGTPDQQSLWLKNVWNRMPKYVRPFFYFTYRYFVRLGFLDGKEGFIFHFLHAFWFRLLVDINVDELERNGISVEEPGSNAREYTHPRS